MQNKDQILARARAYELFAELFTLGISESNLEYVKLIPELRVDIGEDNDNQQADPRESDHYDIFGKNIFPYESIFLDKEMNLGGEIAESVSDYYHRIGFAPPSTENPDHIGVELSALAYLSRIEIELQDNPGSNETIFNRESQIELLDRHILQWLPMLHRSLIGQQNQFYISLCDLTMELLLDHHAILNERGLGISTVAVDESFTILEDSKTSLKDIAIYLLTPASSGVFISQAEISRIAKQLELPRGFGNRVQLLNNLFRTAISFDTLPKVLDEIKEILISWSDYYDQLSERNGVLSPLVDKWSSKISNSKRVISQVKNASLLEFVDS